MICVGLPSHEQGAYLCVLRACMLKESSTLRPTADTSCYLPLHTTGLEGCPGGEHGSAAVLATGVSREERADDRAETVGSSASVGSQVELQIVRSFSSE